MWLNGLNHISLTTLTSFASLLHRGSLRGAEVHGEPICKPKGLPVLLQRLLKLLSRVIAKYVLRLGLSLPHLCLSFLNISLNSFGL